MGKTLIFAILLVLFVSCASTDVSMTPLKNNPHRTGADCLACHDKPPNAESVTFLFEGDLVKVCRSCHENEDEVHPVSIKVPRWMKECVPTDFILKNGDTITCITCHDFKDHTNKNTSLKNENPKFLRGWPYDNLSDMCHTCHNSSCAPGFNPHIQLDVNGEIIESMCLFCHSVKPDIEVPGIGQGMLKGNPSTYCYGCHAKKEEGHPAKITHLDKALSEAIVNCIEKAKNVGNGIILPLLEGTVYCGTCHNPHQKGVLKGTANIGAGERFMLRLPEGDDPCSACHCDKGK